MPTGIGGEVGWWVPSLTVEASTTVTNQVGGINNASLATSNMWNLDADGKRCISATAGNKFTVAHNASFVLPANYSFSIWIKAASFINNYAVSNKADNSPRVLAITSHSNGLYCQHGTLANQYFSASFGVITVNTWTNLIITHSKVGSTYTLSAYKNGVLTAASSHTSTPNSSTSSFEINSNQGIALPIKFDDLRIFYETINSTKISQLSSVRGYEPPTTTSRRRAAQASIRSTL